MANLSEAPQNQTLGQVLAHVSRLVGRRRSTKLAGIGLHHAQGMILSQLWRNDGLPQLELARALHIQPPTASNTLQRMERDGWVTRRREDADQRVVRVYMTEKARNLHEELRALFRELDHELSSALTVQEQKDFKKTLLKVHDYLAATAEEPCCPPQAPETSKGQKK
ncbi:MarR family transcriptional regulator [uncultured Desulfuromusa sp.]|uniref:MarR family winged helix-turn-helix transcriptional regulator n=1 Tax=uncultured Desulfuromusa sp. TaxID=219183 RepID=UPI002AA6CAD0|nr:MarR family transcriptional regulator [uncultured Desulfuromusa sp.]